MSRFIIKVQTNDSALIERSFYAKQKTIPNIIIIRRKQALLNSRVNSPKHWRFKENCTFRIEVDGRRFKFDRKDINT